MRRPRSVLAVAAAGLLLAGCGLKSSSTSATPSSTPSATPSATATPTATTAAMVDPASVGANELGKVPVFMYHQILAAPAAKDEYSQTPEHFKNELQTLYDLKFRPITAADLVAGKIDLPAGMHPMVMTFDDGTTSQAGLDPSGNPKPDTALGMMEDFNKSHSDWHSTATFYVNDAPFQDPKVLPWLVAHGYEVGVHTKTHPILNHLTSDQLLKEIGGNYTDIQTALPGYKITTMARPFGSQPTDPALRPLLHDGTYNGVTYHLSGEMLVGAQASVSPYASAFDPLAVARIRSASLSVLDNSDYWIPIFKAHPNTLYTSDGNPDKISYPASDSAKPAATYQSKANPYGSSSSTSTSSPSASPKATTSHSPTSTSTPRSTSSPSPSSSSSASPTASPTS